jgi:hypothetical protein
MIPISLIKMQILSELEEDKEFRKKFKEILEK